MLAFYCVNLSCLVIDFDVNSRSKEAVNITGWSLSNISDGSEGNEFTYKFPRGVNLGPDESCTVWSSDSQQVMNM